VSHALVDRHFAGSASASEDRRMWRHLPGCERCRKRYRALTLLESLDGDGGERARQRMARAVFAPAPPRRTIALLAAVGAAALVLLVALPRDRFRARGGEEIPVASQPALAIFRVPPGGTPERVGAVVRAGDALAFSYVNPAGAPYLLVFASDEAGHIYWFWPAWTAAASDPAALPIQASAAPVELAEAVRHPLGPGRLTVHALFARQPYHVRAVETALVSGGLGTLEGVLVSQPLEVLP
jgi:hypothetical protein